MDAIEFRYEFARPGICNAENSQGIVTLHSLIWKGRAIAALDKGAIKREATNTDTVRMQDSICEACPKGSAANLYG
jgi:hypothetical protein